MKETIKQIVIWSFGCIVLGYFTELFGFTVFLFIFLLMITASDRSYLRKTKCSSAILQTDTFRKLKYSLRSEVSANVTQRKEFDE